MSALNVACDGQQSAILAFRLEWQDCFLQYHYLKAEDEQPLQKGSDGNRRMFYNGISNTPDDAARNAVQLSDNEHEPLYFTYFPQAEDKLVEFGIAIYQYFWGWSNSSKKYQNLVLNYGNDGLLISAHSRGSLTVGNGMRDFEKHGVHDIAKKQISIFLDQLIMLKIWQIRYIS